MKGVSRFIAQRPLALAAGCYALGAAIGDGAQVPALYWCGGLLLCALGLALRRRPIWIFCGLLFAGAWACAWLNAQPAVLPQPGELTGRVRAVHEESQERLVLTLDQAALDGTALDTRVRLYDYGQDRALPGDVICCQAEFWLPKGRTNPGGFDFAAWLRRDGVRLCATASGAEVQPGPPGLTGWLGRLRQDISFRLEQLFPGQDQLAKGMLLGDKKDLPQDIYDQYRDAGVAHLLAVSGLHVSCLAAAVCWALAALGMGRGAAYGVTVVLAGLYALLVGAPASALRAVCMFALVGGARQAGLPYDGLTGLGAAALALLAANPLQIGDTGFILSFSAVLGMLLLSRPLDALLRVGRWPRKLRWVGSSLAVSLAAQLGTLPAVCCFFGQITPYAPLTNLPAILLCSLALPLIGLALLCHLLWPPLGMVAALLPRLCLGALQEITAWVAGLPGATLAAPAWPWWLAALFAVLGLWASGYLAGGRLVKGVALAGLPLCLGLSLALAWWAIPDGLTCLFLDAGQADAAVVTAQKRTYLIDLGEAGGPVMDYLRYTGRQVDGVFLSHGHADHGGGLLEVLKERRVPVIYLPQGFEAAGVDEQVAQALDLARSQGVEIRYLAQGGQVSLSAQVRAQVMAPPADSAARGNAISMVLRVSLGEGAALFTGDWPASQETGLLLPANLVKAAHHGSGDATSEFLLRALSPSACVISVGRNGYGHPSDQLLRRLDRLGIAMFRTDRDGAVLARILPDGTLEMETFL